MAGPRLNRSVTIGEQRRRGKLAAMSASSSAQVSDHRAQSRFEINIEGATAFLLYERTDTSLTLIHTEVPPALRDPLPEKRRLSLISERALRGARLSSSCVLGPRSCVRSLVLRPSSSPSVLRQVVSLL